MDNQSTEFFYSILIPVRNTKQYIEQCLDSVLIQKYKNFEVIIVDNESDDGSEAIIDTYAESDKRIKVVHQKNAGLLMSRRKALSMAKGDYICFLDSDDYWQENFLGIVNNALNENNFDMLVVGYQEIDETGNIIDNEDVPQLCQNYQSNNIGEFFLQMMGHPILNNLWLKVVKRECFDLKLDDEYLKLGHVNGTEGAIQSLEILQRVKSIRCIPNEKLYMYRIRQSSTIHNGAMKYFRECKQYHKFLFEFMSNNLQDNYYALAENLHIPMARFAIFSVIRNIVLSDQSYSKKKNELKEIINDEMFEYAVKDIKKPSNNREAILWLTKKRLFMFLTIIISLYSKKAVKNDK